VQGASRQKLLETGVKVPFAMVVQLLVYHVKKKTK
jgi:hypothetical protein